MTDWPAKTMEVLRETSGHTEADTLRIMSSLHERGFVIVPVHELPDETVSKVISHTRRLMEAQ